MSCQSANGIVQQTSHQMVAPRSYTCRRLIQNQPCCVLAWPNRNNGPLRFIQLVGYNMTHLRADEMRYIVTSSSLLVVVVAWCPGLAGFKMSSMMMLSTNSTPQYSPLSLIMMFKGAVERGMNLWAMTINYFFPHDSFPQLGRDGVWTALRTPKELYG